MAEDPYRRHITERDRDVAEFYALADRGISFPFLTVTAARRRGLILSAACALLDLETAGGANVFGHDPVRWPQIKGGPVTRTRYLRYKALRRLCGNQGVGPGQLTYPGFQDRADDRGGCWHPGVNMDVSFEIFEGYVRTSGFWAAAKAYNGAESYADKYMVALKKWQRWFESDRRARG